MFFTGMVVAILFLVGVLGAAGIIRFPGLLLLWAGIVLYAMAGGWAVFSRGLVVEMGLVAVAGETAGHLLGVWRPTDFSQERLAIVGVGSFLVLGVVLGLYLGAGAWELFIGRQVRTSLRLGVMALLRRFAGRLLRFATALGMIIFFLFHL